MEIFSWQELQKFLGFSSEDDSLVEQRRPLLLTSSISSISRVGKCQIFYMDQYQQTRFYPRKARKTFYPNWPIFLHGYIRHIRDIFQLCQYHHNFSLWNVTISTIITICPGMEIWRKCLLRPALFLRSKTNQKNPTQKSHLEEQDWLFCQIFLQPTTKCGKVTKNTKKSVNFERKLE